MYLRKQNSRLISSDQKGLSLQVIELSRFNCNQLCSAGVNFTIILRAAFTRKDPNTAKKGSPVKQLFALSGPGSVKAARKHVDEIDPRMRI